MEKCKTVDAKVEFWKTLMEKLFLLVLALAGSLGTLLLKYKKEYLLISITALLLFFFSLGWIFTILLWKKEISKLENCVEEES
jgi:hypothetical protein